MQSYLFPPPVRKRGRRVPSPEVHAAPPYQVLPLRKRRARSSPVFDDKTIDAALLTVLDEHIASRLAKRGDVGYRAWVRGQHLELGSHRQLGQCLASLQDWQRTGQAFGIKRLVGHEGLQASFGSAYISEPKALATTQPARQHPSSCAGPGGGPRCRFETGMMAARSPSWHRARWMSGLLDLNHTSLS